MDLAIFPTTASAVFTVAGAAVLCVVVTQWLKTYITDARLYNAVGLGVTFVLVEVAGVFLVDGTGIWERLYVGLLVALSGASLATFGYELMTNLAGLAGIGKRSNAGLNASAVKQLTESAEGKQR